MHQKRRHWHGVLTPTARHVDGHAAAVEERSRTGASRRSARSFSLFSPVQTSTVRLVETARRPNRASGPSNDDDDDDGFDVTDGGEKDAVSGGIARGFDGGGYDTNTEFACASERASVQCVESHRPMDNCVRSEMINDFPRPYLGS